MFCHGAWTACIGASRLDESTNLATDGYGSIPLLMLCMSLLVSGEGPRHAIDKLNSSGHKSCLLCDASWFYTAYNSNADACPD